MGSKSVSQVGMFNQNEVKIYDMLKNSHFVLHYKN